MYVDIVYGFTQKRTETALDALGESQTVSGSIGCETNRARGGRRIWRKSVSDFETSRIDGELAKREEEFDDDKPDKKSN